MRNTPVLIALTLLLAGICFAQEAPQLTGKVYLMNGTTYEGAIEVAEFGVKEGAGIGSDPSMACGYMSVLVDGQEVKVPFADIAAVEAKWQKPEPDSGQKWLIDELTITRKDGTQVIGKPHWLLYATTVRVLQADGTLARAHAFPTASPDFDPGTLLTKVEIGEAAAPSGTATTTAPPAGTTTPPAGTTTEPTGPTGVEPVSTAPPTGVAPQPVVGAPTQLTLTVICPKCGEKITIVVNVSAKTGE
jgi:hypothetical protein